MVASIAMLGASGSFVARADQPGHGSGKPGKPVSAPIGTAQTCPPGLKDKNVPCLPPGRFKKQFEIGEHVPASYKGLMRYDALPYEMRMGYGGALDPSARYVYDDHFLYRVDPTTMIVRQILRALP